MALIKSRGADTDSKLGGEGKISPFKMALIKSKGADSGKSEVGGRQTFLSYIHDNPQHTCCFQCNQNSKGGAHLVANDLRVNPIT